MASGAPKGGPLSDHKIFVSQVPSDSPIGVTSAGFLVLKILRARLFTLLLRISRQILVLDILSMYIVSTSYIDQYR